IVLRSTRAAASSSPGWWCRSACAAVRRSSPACCTRWRAARRGCSWTTSTSSPSACTSALAGKRPPATAGSMSPSTSTATCPPVRRPPMRLENAGAPTWLLAGVAGWALLAWLLAAAGMGGRIEPLPDDPSLLKPLPAAAPASASRLGPLDQYAEIAARPLFSPDRQPQPFFLQGEGEQADDTAFDYVLTSVLITPGTKLAIIQPPDGSESVRVRLDQAPESHPAWRLIGISPRSAVFEGPEGQRNLVLRVFDGEGGAASTPQQSADAGAQRRD